MEQTAKKSFNKKGSAKNRRISALNLLQMQFNSGLKREKGTNEHIALTEQDKARMNKEMDTLRNRLK